jgi:hypothetical protein
VSEFDYTATDTPDDVVRKVVADISGRRLRPLTNGERMEREAWRSEMACVLNLLALTKNSTAQR